VGAEEEPTVTAPFSDLPKFPGEEPSPPPRPESPDTPADRLRHAFPALVMLAGVGVGLLLVVGLAVVLLARGIAAGWIEPVLILVIFLTLPAVAITAAFYQRAKLRRDRME
jgi:hypothetical protein